jgi:hypothetical protein
MQCSYMSNVLSGIMYVYRKWTYSSSCQYIYLFVDSVEYQKILQEKMTCRHNTGNYTKNTGTIDRDPWRPT